MPLSDIVAAALSRPAGRVVEAPVRTIVNEVLQDHGYASPAEVQALKDRIAALSKLIDSLETRMVATEQAAEALRIEVETLRAAPAAPSTRPVADPAEYTPAEGASDDGRPPGVDELGGDAVHRWKAGRLPGYVGPEGLVEIDGQPYRIDAALAGRPFEVSGSKVKRIRVDGAWVKKTAL